MPKIRTSCRCLSHVKATSLWGENIRPSRPAGDERATLRRVSNPEQTNTRMADRDDSRRRPVGYELYGHAGRTRRLGAVFLAAGLSQWTRSEHRDHNSTVH